MKDVAEKPVIPTMTIESGYQGESAKLASAAAADSPQAAGRRQTANSAQTGSGGANQTYESEPNRNRARAAAKSSCEAYEARRAQFLVVSAWELSACTNCTISGAKHRFAAKNYTLQ